MSDMGSGQELDAETIVTALNKVRGEVCRHWCIRCPSTVRARLGTTLSIERTGLPPAVVASLKHLSSIANPEFYEKQRMRFSTWNTPRFISCYREDLEYLHLPRGLTERAIDLLGGLGCQVDLIDDRTNADRVDLVFVGELHPQQVEAFSAVIKHNRGVLVAPPGAGKTVMACAVIAHYQTPLWCWSIDANASNSGTQDSPSISVWIGAGSGGWAAAKTNGRELSTSQ
jgi:hypothetical protein